MTKLAILLTTSLVTSLLTSASANAAVMDVYDDMVWQYGQYNDQANNGRATSWLSLTIPETDATAIRASCAAGSGSNTSTMTFVANVSTMREKQPAFVIFYNESNEFVLRGNAIGTQAEDGMAGIDVVIDNDSSLWAALSSWQTIQYTLLGEERQTTAPGAAQGIENFLRDCHSYAKIQPSAQPSNKVGGQTEGQPTNDTPDVHGLNVKEVYFNKGGFVQADNGEWNEYDSDNRIRFTFIEQDRDQWSVRLRDNSRGVNLQLDLYRKKIVYSDDKGQNFDLYDVTNAFKGLIQSTGLENPTSTEIIEYNCNTDIPLRLTFDHSGSKSLVTWKHDMVQGNQLPEIESASGVKYSDGRFTVWVKGDEVALNLDGIEDYCK